MIYYVILFIIALIIFLYAIDCMSNGLEQLAGNRLENILSKTVDNKYVAVITGVLITSLIHSSSAVSVILIGFVRAKLIHFRQAMWVMLGANVGTTITSQIVALDLSHFSIYLWGAGLIIMLIFYKRRYFPVGQVLVALGILFCSMNLMVYSMSFLQQERWVLELLVAFNNPIFALFCGIIFTALIQSSSASIGVLQSLSMSGLVALPQAIWIIYGQNIGTCITAILASIKSNKDAKRVAISHLWINILGMFIFIPLTFIFPILSYIEAWTPNNPASQIANFHTLYNLVSTIILLPLDFLIEYLTYYFIPEEVFEYESNFS